MKQKFFIIIFYFLVNFYCKENEGEVIIKDFDESIAQEIFENGKQTMIMFTNDKQLDEKFSVFQIAVQEFKNQFIYCKTNINEDIGGKLGTLIGVTDSMLPTVELNQNIYDGRDIKKYRLDKELTVENIQLFVNDYTKGILTLLFKSEDIPDLNDKLVLKIVGKNFEDIVMNPTKDVLVRFHAPWCKDCKQWIPVFKKVAQQLEHNENIIICEYDRFLNENPETINITELPAILFFPSNDKSKPIAYTSNRNQQAIIDFLKQHTTLEWAEKAENYQEEEL